MHVALTAVIFLEHSSDSSAKFLWHCSFLRDSGIVDLRRSLDSSLGLYRPGSASGAKAQPLEFVSLLSSALLCMRLLFMDRVESIVTQM
jgi:hypothetical protein